MGPVVAVAFFSTTRAWMDRNSASEETLKAMCAKTRLANEAISCDSSLGRLLRKAVAPSGWSGAPADDLHAKNVPVEFRRRRRVCGAYSNVVDTVRRGE